MTRDAIGAKILVDTAHQKNLWREVFSTIGYLTSPPKEQHLGLGTDTRADVTIIWPNGDRQTLKDLAADRTYRHQGPKVILNRCSDGYREPGHADLSRRKNSSPPLRVSA